MNNNINNRISYNNQNNQIPIQQKKGKKTSFIMSVTVIGTVIILTLIRNMLGTSPTNQNQLNDDEKNQKILNEKVQEKDYVLSTGELLIQLINNTNIPARASIKIEFYGKNKSIIDVKNTTISGIAKQTTSYVKVSLRNIEYDTYKVSTKLTPNPYMNLYTNDIKIISSKESNRNIIIEYQNKSSSDIDYVEIGVLFYDNNHKIVAYNNTIDKDISKNATSSTKIYIPYNQNYELMKYKKIEPVVVNAVTFIKDEK